MFKKISSIIVIAAFIAFFVLGRIQPWGEIVADYTFGIPFLVLVCYGLVRAIYDLIGGS